MTDAAAAAPAGAAPAAAPAGQKLPQGQAKPQTTAPAAKPAGNAAPAAKDAAAAKPGDRHKVKGEGGRELEVDIEELKRGYGHMQAANERMRVASEKEKAADAKMQGAGELEAAFKAAEKGDFTHLVRKVGYEKAKEFAEMLLLAEIEWNEMSPEQQRAARAEKEIAGYRKRDADAKAAETAKKKAAETESAFKDIDTEVSAALKELGKTPTPRVVMRVIEHLLADIESDETKARPVSAKDAYKRVVNDMHAEIGEYLGGLSAAELREVLPAAVLDTLRNADVEDVLTQDPLRSGRRPASTNQQQDNERRRKRIPHDDYWARKEKKFGGR